MRVTLKDDPARKLREQDTLERSFERFQFRIGKHDWKRTDLYARSRAAHPRP